MPTRQRSTCARHRRRGRGCRRTRRVFCQPAELRRDGSFLIPREALRKTRVVPRLAPNEFHVFISHYQYHAGDACGILKRDLRDFGLEVWLDQDQREINADAMLRGVEQSRVYLLFLCKDVFKRPYVLKEARRALELGKPVLLVHESDPARVEAYAPISELIAQAPPDLGSLFRMCESEPFQRRAHLQQPMTLKLVDRIVRAMGG